MLHHALLWVVAPGVGPLAYSLVSLKRWYGREGTTNPRSAEPASRWLWGALLRTLVTLNLVTQPEKTMAPSCFIAPSGSADKCSGKPWSGSSGGQDYSSHGSLGGISAPRLASDDPLWYPVSATETFMTHRCSGWRPPRTS